MENRPYPGSGNKQMNQEMENIQGELQQKVDSLQSELELTILRRECRKYEARALELQERLRAFEEKEHLIADVLLNAQTQANRVENQAREKVRQMEARVYEDIRRKTEELAELRLRVGTFMEEVQQMLHSIQYALTSPDSASWESPTLFATDFRGSFQSGDDYPTKKTDAPTSVSLDPASGKLIGTPSFPKVAPLNLIPEIKIQHLQIVPRKLDLGASD